MLQFFAKYKFFGIVLLVLSAIIISVMYYALNTPDKLKIFQPVDISDESLLDPSIQFVKKYHTISDFKLINQNGDTITQDDYPDIYVADFIFTTCVGICPIMTQHMVQIQEVLKDEPRVKLLSHSVTPEIDSVAQLKKYALQKGVNDSKWNLVTGDRKQIYDLARKSYMVAVDLPEEQAYGMIHTENFVLVDSKKRIRGMYDGTSPDDIARLLEEIEILKKER